MWTAQERWHTAFVFNLAAVHEDLLWIGIYINQGDYDLLNERYNRYLKNVRLLSQAAEALGMYPDD